MISPQETDIPKSVVMRGKTQNIGSQKPLTITGTAETQAWDSFKEKAAWLNAFFLILFKFTEYSFTSDNFMDMDIITTFQDTTTDCLDYFAR